MTKNEIKLKRVLPDEIEKMSMSIIEEELQHLKDRNLRNFTKEEEKVVKRAIHTGADFDYYENLIFSKKAVETGIKAIMSGVDIVTDTNMARAGINKKKLKEFGSDVTCFMADEDVAKAAKENYTTRATACIDKAADLKKPVIFVIGNAPTALVRIFELIKSGRIEPILVIGVPVGFVNVIESKELILGLDETEYIVARGRKGGSNIAAAICNAMIYMAVERANL